MINDSIECPLCMEPIDFDDVDFYPCPCRYQICRFCWDKILHEENGLCPACRKVYNSENPASYKPRTEEEIKNKIKHSKKVCTKKTKPAQEGKEYLSEYRVLQKNLIFVVGLPMRMAEEVELLKGLEYFGKCGKVYKIVINQNQTFPGPQGTPCLSAYVTYHRNEDALKTLVDLKKLEIDGRAVKLSLGTTKYCSQFLRNRRCTKQDCMYLHEMGDHAASFTKDDMANGKHTEYENQLIQEFFDNQKVAVVTVSPLTTTPLEQDKSTTRKSSLSSSSQTTTCVNCVVATAVMCSKSQRPPFSCQITPIATDLCDANKIYSVSENSKITVIKVDQCKNKDGQSSHESPDISTVAVPPQSCDLIASATTTSSPSPDFPFMHAQNTDASNSSQSLLDSFYYLNSQTSNSCGNIQSPYEQSVSHQVNNNGVSSYPQYQDFLRTAGSDKSNSAEQKCKDTADIDFDPIDVSRMGLAELIANENLQKMNNYPQQIFSHHRNMLRPNQHEYMMSSNNDFYHPNSRGPGQPPNEGRISQQMSNMMGIGSSMNSNTSASVAPPPGFEVTHSNSCIGEPQSMNIMMNHNNVDMYNRYQNQHPNSDMPMGMNHHNSQYSNQYSIPTGNNYHSDFSSFSNGPSMGYNDASSQSHPWKNAQSLFCDGVQDVPHAGLRSAAYNRSQSMNENTAGQRHSEWNGFASYNNSSDAHTSNYPFY